MATDIPERIGPYKIRAVLGRGGMGVVYDGEHVETGARIAIKTVIGLKRRYVQSVRREVRALSRLSHPGIVRIIDEGEHEGAPWYGMEFVDGLTLRAYRRALRHHEAMNADTAAQKRSESFLEALRLCVETANDVAARGGVSVDINKLPHSGSRNLGSAAAAALLDALGDDDEDAGDENAADEDEDEDEGETRTHFREDPSPAPKTASDELLEALDEEAEDEDEDEGETRTHFGPGPPSRGAQSSAGASADVEAVGTNDGVAEREDEKQDEDEDEDDVTGTALGSELRRARRSRSSASAIGSALDSVERGAISAAHSSPASASGPHSRSGTGGSRSEAASAASSLGSGRASSQHAHSSNLGSSSMGASSHGSARSSKQAIRLDVRTGRAIAVDASGKVRKKRRASKQPIRPDQLANTLQIFQRLCPPLEFVHGLGLVHRDLKPDNVLVRDDGRPVLLDFGLVTHATGRAGRDGLEELGALGAGTASYMAPEQIRGEFVDARADIYSLGCMLYEAIAGRPPFRSGHTAGILARHLTKKPASLRDVVPWLAPELDQFIVDNLLAKDPRHRVGRAGDLGRRLQELGGTAGDWDLGPPAAPFLFRPALAGRSAELTEAIALLDRLEVQEGGVLLIGGESGLGKTRLALEIARQATERDTLILTGECHQRGSQPLGALKRVLQLVADRCNEGGQDATKTLLGQRGKILAAYEPSLFAVPGIERLPEPAPLPAREARSRLYASLFETLLALSKNTKTMVILDDLQWADELTLGFLRMLADRVDAGEPAPFLFLGTFRSDESKPTLDEVAAHRGTRLLALKPLDGDESSVLVQDTLGAEATPEQFAAFVSQQAQGNPFYISEYVRAAVEDHVIARQDSGLWEDNSAAPALPTSLSELIARRLRGLTAHCNFVVESAAVVGREVEHDVLARMTSLDDEAIYDAVIDLTARQILEQAPDGSLRFVHDKLAEATYAQIEEPRRADMHRAAAAALEETYPDRVEALAEPLAVHHDLAGNRQRAADYLLIAGDRARALYANTDAERIYERAVQTLLDIDDGHRAAKTLMKLGLVFTAAFDADRAKDAYDRAFALWRDVGRRDTDALPSGKLAIAAGDPVSLDPARSYDSDSSFFQVQLFEGLVELDDDHNVLPACAAAWEVLDGGTRYLFHLRDDAKWSDGRAVTAGDFEFAWKRNLLPSTGSPAAQLLYVVENAQAFHEGRIKDADEVGVTALDRRVLEVRLKAPTAYLPHLLSHPITYPQPWWLLQKVGHGWTAPEMMVTNGPYCVESRVHGEYIKLFRSPSYTGRFPGNADEIDCRVFSDYRDALDAYADGEIAVLDLISASSEIMDAARTGFADTFSFIPLLSTNYLLFRCDEPPLDDVRVRRALSLAIDRARLATVLEGTEHQTALGGFVPPGLPGHSPGLALAWSPDEARALIAEVKAEGGPLPPLRWLYTHGLGDATFIELLTSTWRETLGLEVTVEHVGWREFEAAVEQGVGQPPHMILGGWIADYPDPDSFLRAVFHSGDGSEPTGWKSERFDRLVETAARTTDQETRLDLYRRADKQAVAEEAVVIPLSYGRNAVLLSREVAHFPAATSYLRFLKDVIVVVDAS